MTPEEATKVRALLGTPEKPWDGPDDTLLDSLASFVGDADAAATTATTDLAAARVSMSQLQTERDDALEAARVAKASEQEVRVSMSQHQPEKVSDLTASLVASAFASEADQLVAAGIMSEAERKATEALFYENGKPGAVSMSMVAGSSDPLLKRLYQIRRMYAGQGIAVGMSVNRGPAAPLPTEDPSNSDPQAKKPTEQSMKELRGMAGIDAD